ncbi:MAG: exonuclease SbcCD subunit D [Clostridium sp.]|nr:exonuclease SbcCD subunit D [Clostridium sp.]
MKLIHLSDLHIGKRVNEFSMLEDQKYILAQILTIIDKERPDGVILAGDIYDKPVPPAEAVKVLDDFLTELAKRQLTVFVISGNHDSPERIAFGAQLMSSCGVHVAPVYDGSAKKIVMEDAYGEVHVHLLPFIKSSAVCVAIEHMDVDRNQRNVLVAHQFVTGAGRCESEEISVGGLDHVDVSLFDDFDYVALGHIHSPQHIGRETVRYCGTPLKYSFSEAEQEKSVTVMELREKGQVEIGKIPLVPLRDMRKLRGTYLEVTALSSYQGTNTEDYVQITLTDEEDIPDGMQKLRVIYPNLMRLEYDNRRTRANREIEGTDAAEQKSELELFEEFYELQNNQPMSRQQRDYVMGLIQSLKEPEAQG